MNIFLLDSRRASEAKIRAKTGLKFGSEKHKIVKPGLLEFSLLCPVAILGAESLFNLLEAIKPCGRYF